MTSGSASLWSHPTRAWRNSSREMWVREVDEGLSVKPGVAGGRWCPDFLVQDDSGRRFGGWAGARGRG